MELYTSLTRLKQEVATGQLPPMTPVPAAVQDFIDPAFTIGMGALEEHPEKGLRCPVRGCGRYFHFLTVHLSRGHKDIGGAAAVRKALDIHSSCKLITARHRAKNSAAGTRALADGRLERAHALARPGRVPKTAHNTGYRNLRDHCEAQVRQKLETLATKIGRSPSMRDTIVEYGDGLVSAMKRVYGTWDNAKAQLGLPPTRYGPHTTGSISRDAVLCGLRAFYEIHNRFPSALEASLSNKTPLVSCPQTTKKMLDAKTWPAAMHAAAVELGLYRANVA